MDMIYQEHLDVLNRVLEAIQRHFAHWQNAQICQAELTALGNQYREMILNDRPDRHSFSLQMMALFGRLNNGHTRFYDPMFEQTPPLGFGLTRISEQWVVKESLLADLQVGDVVFALDGKSVDAWFRELEPYAVGSPQSRSVQFGDWNSIFPPLLRLFLPQRLSISFFDGQGSHRSLDVDRGRLAEGSRPASVKPCWLTPEIAYLGIPSFFTPAFEEDALACIQQYRSAVGMVIDLRGNAGGTTPRHLTQALMDRPCRWWTYADAAHPDRVSGSWTMPAADAYPGRLALLVDRHTWSAAEDFAMPFKDNGRAIVVGETTGGSTGQPHFDSFSNGMRFSIGAMRVWFPDGSDFEGLGITPDVPVMVQREDLATGHDPVLETALQLLKEAEQPFQ